MLKNFTISTKILIGFCVPIIIMIVIGINGYQGTAQMNDLSTDSYVYQTEAFPEIAYIIRSYNLQRISLYEMVRNINNADKVESTWQDFQTNRNVIITSSGVLSEKLLTTEGQTLLADLTTALDSFAVIADDIHQASVAGDLASANNLIDTQSTPMVATVRGLLQSLIDNKIASAQADAENVTAVGDRSVRITIALIVVGVVLSVIVGILLANSLSRPLKKVSEAMGKVGLGDLTVALKHTGRDEVVDMANNVDQTVLALQASVSGVKGAAVDVQTLSESLALTAQQMATATGEVSSAIQAVAQGSTNQAADLTEIVGMLNVFAEEMNEISGNVGIVRDNSQTAESKALEGKTQITALTSSITSISQSFSTFLETISNLGLSVNKIGDITDAINAISDQTNLLALNAAIEAARAGEQGKGFAVVADEVRNLAAESKKSSKEIMELIRTVSQETQGVIRTSQEVSTLLQGQEQVINETVSSFQQITDAVEAIAPLVENTRNSVDRAVKAKDAVVGRVEGVAAVSEEVSASAEEIAASSEQLLASIDDVSGVAEKTNQAVNGLVEKVRMYKTE